MLLKLSKLLTSVIFCSLYAQKKDTSNLMKIGAMTNQRRLNKMALAELLNFCFLFFIGQL